MPSIIRKILDLLLVIPVSLIPQRFLSSKVHSLAMLEQTGFKNFLIKTFHRIYKVDLSEAKKERVADYKSFAEFFTRELKPEARLIATDENALISPVDGTISRAGMIKHDLLYQAKGHYYSLSDLITDDKLAENFINGHFITIYLSPRDYHRVHMPTAGKLNRMLYVPGRLWPVNPPSVRQVSSLFARNERAILEFNTDEGRMLLIMVGALFVGSIETVFAGKLAPPYQNQVKTYNYQNLEYSRGDEIGRFNLGSTVILLFEHESIKLTSQEGKRLRMGESLNHII